MLGGKTLYAVALAAIAVGSAHACSSGDDVAGTSGSSAGRGGANGGNAGSASVTGGAGVGWSGREQVENNATDAAWPLVVLDGSGRATTAWLQDSAGKLSVWASSFE